jgi:hypothetical protein
MVPARQTRLYTARSGAREICRCVVGMRPRPEEAEITKPARRKNSCQAPPQLPGAPAAWSNSPHSVISATFSWKGCSHATQNSLKVPLVLKTHAVQLDMCDEQNAGSSRSFRRPPAAAAGRAPAASSSSGSSSSSSAGRGTAAAGPPRRAADEDCIK